MAAASDADLLRDTAHYLYAFDGASIDAGEPVFATMDRAAYHRSIFLDRRISPAADGELRRPVAELVAALGKQPLEPPGWIFHIAHCGSTLLARALDRPDGPLVLREPLALRQIGVAAAQGDALGPALRLAVALYGRADGGRTAVKANVPVNFAAHALLAVAPEAPAILLYYPLEAYLLAILRSDNHRGWVRFITGELRPGIERWAGSLAALSDAELAAVLWLAQLRIYADLLARFPGARSLSADTLFDRPAETLAAAAALFGRADDPAWVAATVAGPVFATYSKNPGVAFDNATRLAMKARTAAALAGDLAAARRLIAARGREFPLPDALDRPLTGATVALLG